jgi:hypothetical protein
MRTLAQANADRRELWRDIKRQHRREAKEKLASLRAEIRATRERRKGALRSAKERCRAERIAARERVRALRLRVLEDLKATVRAERLAARQSCTVRLGEARSIKDDIQRARAALLAERKYQADLRRIEAAHRQRRREAPGITRLERQGESDDEVRANVPPDLAALFERVKRSIKASPRMSRTEAFLKYAEEHPDEVLVAIDDKTDALIRELEQKEREAARALRRGPPRPSRYTPEQLAEVPF